MATKLCSSLLQERSERANYGWWQQLILPTWIPNQTSPFSHDEFHSAIVIFGELNSLWIGSNLFGRNQEPIREIVVRCRQCRIWRSKNSFNCTSVYTVSSNDQVTGDCLAVGQGDRSGFGILKHNKISLQWTQDFTKYSAAD